MLQSNVPTEVFPIWVIFAPGHGACEFGHAVFFFGRKFQAEGLFNPFIHSFKSDLDLPGSHGLKS